MESTASLNDNLVKIDNLVTALNYIFEEIETRKQEYTNAEKIEESLKSLVDSKMESGIFVRWVAQRVADDYWWNIVRDVESNTRGSMEAIINQRIESVVRQQLERLGYTQQNTNQ